MKNKKFQTYNLNMDKFEYDETGIKDYFFPLNYKHLDNFREKIMLEIKTFLNKDELTSRKYKECIRLFFKWFFKDILNFLYAVYLIEEYKKNNKEIYISSREDFLYRINTNKVPQTPFEKLWAGPKKQNFVFKSLKKIIRQFQFNNIKNLTKFDKKINIFHFASLIKENIKNEESKNYFHYEEDFFKKIDNKIPYFNNNNFSFNQKKNYLKLNKLLKSIFKELNLPFPKICRNYFFNWITQGDLFLDFHEKNYKKVDGEVHITSAGNTLWTKMLCKFSIDDKKKVVNYDHGSGGVLHDFLPRFFTDLSYISEYVTHNEFHKSLIEKRHKDLNKFNLYDKKFLINFIQNKKNLFNLKPTKKIIKDKKLKILYVSTVYLGYETRFRPVIPNIMYFDFQIRLINLLKEISSDITIKPHPEGKYKTPVKNLNCKHIYTKFENIKDIDKYDLIITDHIASSTIKSMIFLDVPVFFINYETPFIYADAMEIIQKGFYVLKTFLDKDNRIMINKEELLFKINKLQKKDTKDKSFLRNLYT